MSTFEGVPVAAELSTAVRPSPFDSMAESYDDAFTHTQIGRLMREAVWKRLDAQFDVGSRLLELNCGTGEDAIHLAERGIEVLATDISPAMVAATERKVEAYGRTDVVKTRVLAIEDVGGLTALGLFDGVLSNFGGFNCVDRPREAAAALASLIRPGGVAALCVMGPWAPWEWAWYLLRLNPGKAFRRLHRRGVPWKGITIRYPSIRTLRDCFHPWFRLERVSAVGALIPPSYADAWAAKHSSLLQSLGRWERRLETIWPLPHLSDHYLVELRRVEDP